MQGDVDKLCDGNVFHIIDVGTSFENGCFINRRNTETAWKLLWNHWIDIYAGAPDFIYADAGTKFNSLLFREKAKATNFIMKIVPTEAHDRTGLFERSHSYLQAGYEKLRWDVPNISRKEALSMAFRAVNDAPSSGTGISPTTLVYRIFPNIPGKNIGSTLS